MSGYVRVWRKKPVEVEAVQITDDLSLAAIAGWMSGSGGPLPTVVGDKRPFGLTIPTLEGDMLATPGDYVIRGVQGEFYPCKPDIFTATYESVDPS